MRNEDGSPQLWSVSLPCGAQYIVYAEDEDEARGLCLMQRLKYADSPSYHPDDVVPNVQRLLKEHPTWTTEKPTPQTLGWFDLEHVTLEQLEHIDFFQLSRRPFILSAYEWGDIHVYTNVSDANRS